jgi:hypothetical protein
MRQAAMKLAAGVALALAALCLLNPVSAGAAFGISAFDGQNTAAAGGGAFTQAGGHPYSAETTIAFNQTTDAKGNPLPDEAVRNLRLTLPLGFVANPLATPTRCTEAQLMAGLQAISVTGFCPDSSQVGTVNLVMPPGFGTFTVPLYNMIPSADEPAQLGFRFLVTDAHVDTRVAFLAGAYRVIAELHDVSNAVPLLGATLTLWGVPADSGHDALRGNCTETTAADLCPVDAPPVPFVRMPTACAASGAGLETSVHSESWPGSSADAAFFSHLPPGLPSPGPQQGPTGCANVPFDPSMSLQPTSHAADSPTGLHVNLSVPQAGLESPGGIAASDLKGAVIELPPGMSVNPAAADGLGACTPAQIGLGNDGEGGCPDSAKIGSLEIQTPLLADPVDGSVYLAAPKDNLFGSLLAIYLVAKGPGFVIKLPGHVEARPDGQLLVSFDDDPQLPFSMLSLDLFGGPRAPLRTPSACGSYTTNATLTPWSGTPPVRSASSFAVSTGPAGGPCPPGAFAPRLSAGTADPLAGRYSPFALRLTREDGEQELRGLGLTLPKGLLAKLAGVPYCPDSVLATIPSAEGTGAAQRASPSCPAASQIGTVTAGAGAGPNPFYVDSGRLYLAGPYKGAPLSVAAVVPALAGPFDLGNVVVRAALEVDPSTAQVTVLSDPIPTLLDGIPLDLRDLRVALSRPEFTLNPTSCAPMAFAGSATSAQGTTAPLSERFQVGSCADLPFKPRLSMRLLGATHRGAHPRLRAVLVGRGGDANIARASVALPHSEFLDQAHIGTVCTRVQFAAEKCPVRSIYGFARAFSPLLDQPLAGPVYLRSSNHTLPDLVAHLQGQVTIDLAGRIDSFHGGVRTTFEALPDAPVHRFVLEMNGGRRGLLVNSTDLCHRSHRATVDLDGQNGKASDSSPALRIGCGKRF